MQRSRVRPLSKREFCGVNDLFLSETHIAPCGAGPLSGRLIIER